MTTFAVIAIFALMLGAIAGWLLARQQGQTLLEQARNTWLMEAANLQTEAQTANRPAAEWQERERATKAELAEHRQTLATTQQQLAAYQTRAQRLPELEQSITERDTHVHQLMDELRNLSGQLAAREEQGRQMEELRQQLVSAAEQQQRLAETITRLTAREQELTTTLQQERQQTQEKIGLLTEARETLSNQFKALANDILEEKSKRFTEQNQQNMGALLIPLHERLQGFGKLVQDTYDKDSKERLTLEHELRRLQELNTRLNNDAVALTNALTGSNNKAQGTWGKWYWRRYWKPRGCRKTANTGYKFRTLSTPKTASNAISQTW
nr:DNA recombination protein RmuC [Paludibacterium denitrificans]